MRTWVDVEAELGAIATERLAESGEVAPVLAAFAGDAPLLLAWLRPFAKGTVDEPIVELLALAGPLGANRLALAVGGRAWSFDDPVLPVVEGQGDLRQRVLVLHLVDGSSGQPHGCSVLHPFAVTDGALCWDPPIRLGVGEGDLATLLLVGSTLSPELAMTTSTRDIVDQARRCAALGHELLLAPEATARVPELAAIQTGMETGNG